MPERISPAICMPGEAERADDHSDGHPIDTDARSEQDARRAMVAAL